MKKTMTAESHSGCPALRRAFDLVRHCHRALLASTREGELRQAVCDALVRQGGYAGASILREEQEQATTTAGQASDGTASHLTLPLTCDDRHFGQLRLRAHDPQALDEHETQLLEEVAEEIAYGLERFALIEQRRRLEALVEAAPDMIGFVEPNESDAPPRTTYLNPAGRTLLGSQAGTGEKGIFACHPEWVGHQMQEKVLPHATEEGSWRGESAVLDAHGNEIPVDLTLIAHRGPEGRITQLSTLMHDIRNHKGTEEALRREAAQAETVTQGLVESLPGLFYLFDAHGTLHRWNRELEQVTGLPGDELRRCRPVDFFPPEYRASVGAAFHQALEHGSTEVEADLLTQDGPAPYRLQAHRITLDGWPFVLGIGMDISEQRAAEAHNRLTATVFEAAHDALMITDPGGHIIELNPAFTEQTGYSREEALGAMPGALLDSHEHRPGFFAAVFAEVAEHGFWEGTIHNQRKDGSLVVHRETIASVRDENGHISHYVATMADVTPIKEAEQRARREREVTDAIVDSLPGVFFFLDRQGYNHRWNRRAADYAGTDPNRPCQRAVHALSFFHPVDRPTVQQHIQAGFEGGDVAELETDLVSRDGHRTPILFNATPIDIGGETYLCGLGIDIRRRRELEEDLRVLARTDPLTGACNRAGFDARLQERLAEAHRYATPFAVALLDLDFFKEVNDVHGHQPGDRILEALVANLGERTRDVDTICRWGGEEFVVLLPQTDTEGARQWAERAREEIAAHPLVEALPRITLSIGVTTYQAGDDADSLIARADEALYAAKEAGRDRVEVR